MKKIYSLLVALVCGVMLSFTQAATIKVHVPQDGSLTGWNLGTVYFWVWNTGAEGSNLQATSEGNGWYSANVTTNNFLVKDGADWAGDSHQSVDQAISGDACYELANGSSKKILTAVSCDGGTTPVNPPTPSGSYYVAGNGVGAWCNGVSWDPGAEANKMTNGSITFTNVPAGTYDFKITQGAWGTNGVNNWDYNYFNAACSNVTAVHSEPDWNIEFTTAQAGDITITFDGSKICVNATGGGTNPGGGEVSASDIYLIGYIDGADVDDTSRKFENGSLTVTFAQKSYVYIKTGDNKYYMAETYTESSPATLKQSVYGVAGTPAEKVGVNAGTWTFTVAAAGDGYTLSFSGNGTTPVNPGGGSDAKGYYMYKGYINGADVEPSRETTLFVNGEASVNITSDSYIFVIYQVDGEAGVQYMTSAVAPSPATLVKDGGEKALIKAGATKLYLYDNGDGTLTLSSDPISGKTPVAGKYDTTNPGGGDGPVIPAGDYYITGDSELFGSWNPAAIKMTDASYTFEDLPAGTYAFKVTQGDWTKTSYGADALGVVSEGLSVTSDTNGNIVLTLDATTTITISFLNSKVNISAAGSEVIIPVGPAYIEYSTATPAGIEDVMLQGFYWDSNQDTHAATAKQPDTGNTISYTMSYYGPTRWDNLLADISDLNQYFDLIWLAPSAKSSGGLGYHPVQMSNQNSDLGSRRSLTSLIDQFHQGGGKVIADIVVNHRGNVSSWCDFATDRFVCSDGTNYGTFTFTAEHITGDDEVWKSTDAGAKTCQTANPANKRGAYDTGESYDPARDLDHTNAYVRSSIKAYLKWLRHEMRYDGFRWDVAGGFGQSYLGEYVDAGKPYISMAEKWEGSAQKLWEFIGRTGNKTGGLDFAVKYTAFNEGIAAGNYSKLRGAGLPGLGHAQYSVPFIDNHDTFERYNTWSTENNEFGGKGNFQAALKGIGTATPTVAQARNNALLNKVLQANAFLLGMPGVPCVFYPHWYSLKTQIKEMILARKAAGITNTSSVNDEAGNGYYKATIQGNRGELLLRVGPNSDYTNCPSGYTRMAGGQSGDNYAMFVKTTSPTKPALGVAPGGGRYIGGTQVSMSATFGADIYYTLDGTEPSATNGTKYTAPVSITVNNTVLKAVAINAAGASPVQTHTYVTENPVRTEPITIKFWKPEGWTACNIWAWNESGNIGSTTAWPGDAAMTDNGDGWWTYTFDMSVDEITGIVFNNGKNGGPQTGDYVADVIVESTCFSWSGINKDDPYVVPCDYTALPEVRTADIRVYPNPATETLYITGEYAMNAQLTVYDITGRRVVSQRNTTGSLQVSTLSSGMYILTVKDEQGRTMQHHFIKK